MLRKSVKKTFIVKYFTILLDKLFIASNSQLTIALAFAIHGKVSIFYSKFVQIMIDNSKNICRMVCTLLLCTNQSKYYPLTVFIRVKNNPITLLSLIIIVLLYQFQWSKSGNKFNVLKFCRYTLNRNRICVTKLEIILTLSFNFIHHIQNLCSSILAYVRIHKTWTRSI